MKIADDVAQNSHMDAYVTVSGVMAPVMSGAIAPISARYLVDLYKSGGRLQHRQALPKHAFWNPDTLNLVDDQWRKFCFVALSYRWLSRGDPDPNAFHLKIIATFLETYLQTTRNMFRIEDAGLFWDFGSLFQNPRDAHQDKLFGEGLAASNVWYGSTKTLALLQPHLPPGFQGTPYIVSGWCFVEATISAAVKPSELRVDLGNLPLDASGNVMDRSTNIMMLMRTCNKGRMVPLLPQRVKELLTNEKQFTSKGDVNKVAKLYQKFL